MFKLFKTKLKTFDAYYYISDSDEESEIDYVLTDFEAKNKRQVREVVVKLRPELNNKRIFIEEK